MDDIGPAKNGGFLPSKMAAVDSLLRSNPELYRGLEKAALAPLLAEEQARRHLQRLKEVEALKASEVAENKAQIRSLMQKVQSLKFQPAMLSDEDATREMKRLRQRLSGWINACFRNTELLDRLREDLQDNGAAFVPNRQHELRAFISSAVSGTFYEHVFGPFIMGLSNEEVFRTIAEKVQDCCPRHVAHHWRTATSIAVEELGDEPKVINSVVAQVETDFAQYFSIDPSRGSTKLRTLVRACIQFKRRLDRQESHYRFFRSAFGTPYNPDTMQHVLTSEDVGNHVQCALWPGLSKESGPDGLVVEPETVLATKTEICDKPNWLWSQNDFMLGLLEIDDWGKTMDGLVPGLDH
ncbi:hypothetical protein BO94DRAFT_561519 [Aspergillus sclerotioniger CBS 115572]|uniref:Uncharacterized protein n=1 Tax=Aspergillus sclerotioniger CBS 115572 TaxID=1450535 RepID=A0A317UX99_9EURO|nr:hypothetical protein BO94DRAFT_561519 [Aspergillus sclerotioniger CBS 115572]PWY65618.1 hypothetical protein BO94DRAFT_561519 [Aspergillus sclerotioniger CBS 115572]